MQKKRKFNTAGIGVLVAVLILCELASMTVLFGRMISYTEAKFVNVVSLTGDGVPDGMAADTVPATPTDESTEDETAFPSGETAASGTQGSGSHPEFRMVAEADIFKLSYNEKGEITVIGAEGKTDKLIAPGTSNLYQFTLANPGDVALDYTLTMEAYITGTDLWIPVNVRVWDYTNKYLLGSSDSMVDVMELNTVSESAELGAGKYAVYNLEWEWPFERADENGDITMNDVYDTMLGNLAVDEDLRLHIVIRTYAEYDEEPENPDAGLTNPPQTGDNSHLIPFILLGIGSLIGLCVIILAFFKLRRKEKQDGNYEQDEEKI